MHFSLVSGGGSISGREVGRDLSDVSDLESIYSASAAGDIGSTGKTGDFTNI